MSDYKEKFDKMRVAGNLAGSVLSSGVISITAGGAGTTATAQSSSEINVK